MLDIRRRTWRLTIPGGQTTRRFVLARLHWKGPERDGPGATSHYEVSVSVQFQPRDLWVGCYWTRSDYRKVLVYLCLIPCLPLRLHFKGYCWAGGIP